MTEAESALRLIHDMAEVLRAVKISEPLEQRIVLVSGRLEASILRVRRGLISARLEMAQDGEPCPR
jgi:hypothetical protein